MGDELLTSLEDIFERLKEFLEDFLNPTETPSEEETGAEDAGMSRSINQAKVPFIFKLQEVWIKTKCIFF